MDFPVHRLLSFTTLVTFIRWHTHSYTNGRSCSSGATWLSGDSQHSLSLFFHFSLSLLLNHTAHSPCTGHTVFITFFLVCCLWKQANKLCLRKGCRKKDRRLPKKSESVKSYIRMQATLLLLSTTDHSVFCSVLTLPFSIGSVCTSTEGQQTTGQHVVWHHLNLLIM